MNSSRRSRRPLTLSESERATLQGLVRHGSTSPAVRLRSSIVLACADDNSNQAVARALDVSPATVAKWRDRFIRLGVAGLKDSVRSGRPRMIDRSVLASALERPSTPGTRPARPTTRELAQRHGISQSSAARIRAAELARADGSPPRPAEAVQPQPVEPRSARELLSDRIYQLVRHKIVAGDLVPGQRIVETEIAKSIGTSQTPAREALRRLAHEGLVTYRPRLGSFVTSISQVEAREAREVRVMIESAAARRAAGHVPAADVHILRSAVDHMTEAARCGDIGAFRDADMLFHRQVCAASGNAMLLRVWQVLEATLWNLHVVSDALYDGDRLAMARQHLDLLAVLVDGDPEETARLFAAHARGEGSHTKPRLRPGVPAGAEHD